MSRIPRHAGTARDGEKGSPFADVYERRAGG